MPPRTSRAKAAAPAAAVPRERILIEAAKLFRSKGYHRTTVRDIAEAVGILSGSLFHHFRSKDEMLIEIMRSAAINVCERADAAQAAGTTPAGRLRRLIGDELDCISKPPLRDYHGVLFFEWREIPALAQSELTRLRTRHNQTWRRVLDDCAAAGVLNCEAEAALRILHGTMNGAMVWYRPGGRYTLAEFADILFALVCRADAAG